MRSGDENVVFTLASGESVPAEVEDDLVGLSFRPVSRAPDPGELPRSVQGTLARLQPLADAVLDTLSGLTARPDQVGVQFGIKVECCCRRGHRQGRHRSELAVKLNWKRPNRCRAGATANAESTPGTSLWTKGISGRSLASPRPAGATSAWACTCGPAATC